MRKFSLSTHSKRAERKWNFLQLWLLAWVGIPLSYFLLDAGTGNGLKSREESLTFFLKNLTSQFENLSPTFFFTDQEVAQIHAIESVFGIYPSLCIWHIKRAIKRKIGGLRKSGASMLDSAGENKLLSIIDNHYFRST